MKFLVSMFILTFDAIFGTFLKANFVDYTLTHLFGNGIENFMILNV